MILSIPQPALYQALAQEPPAIPASARLSLSQEVIALGDLVRQASQSAGVSLEVEDDAIAGEPLTVHLDDVPLDVLMKALAALDSIGDIRLRWVRSEKGYRLVADERARQIARTLQRRVANELYRSFLAAAELARRDPAALEGLAQSGDATARRILDRTVNTDPFPEKLQLIAGLLKDGTIAPEALLDGADLVVPSARLSAEQERLMLTIWSLPLSHPLPNGQTQKPGPQPNTVHVRIHNPGEGPIPYLSFGLGHQGPRGSSFGGSDLIGDRTFRERWEEKLRSEWQSDGAPPPDLASGMLPRKALLAHARTNRLNLIAHLPSKVGSWPDGPSRPRFLAAGQTYPRLMGKQIGPVLTITSLEWLMNASQTERLSWKLQQRVEQIAARPAGCATWEDVKQLVALGSDWELKTFDQVNNVYSGVRVWRPLIEHVLASPEFEKALLSAEGAPLPEALLKRLAGNHLAFLDQPERYRAARRIRLRVLYHAVGPLVPAGEPNPGFLVPSFLRETKPDASDLSRIGYSVEIINRDGTLNPSG